ncbi:MAG TPA: HAD-IA family hydrolase, partial [Hyphomicrobium sp.]|nr:HAD-IA family hydrolase [Hyphomicrobium sp.]
ENVARKIGVLHLFEDICDIAALDFVPKPDHSAFEHMVRRHAVDARKATMFEDMPHNLESPHVLGMTTVFVHSDYIDHPAQLKVREWRQLPDHIHHMTRDLTDFLETQILKPAT